MKKIILILAITITTNLIYSQSWKYETIENPFDGKSRIASVSGQGTNLQFNKPSLVVNVLNEESVHFYIANAGIYQYFSNLEILWVFSNEPKTIYKSSNFSISDDGKILFFDDFKGLDSENQINIYDFIEKLKSGNKIDVRIKNEYGKNDLSFSLTGSQKAIDYVISQEYKNKVTENENEEIERIKKVQEYRNKEIEKRKKLDALIGSINNSQTNTTPPENKTSYNLISRKIIYQAKPEYKKRVNEEGLVIVEIHINREGIVTEAKTNVRSSTTNNKYLIEASINAALQTRYNQEPNAPKSQIGTIQYRFSLTQ